MHTQQTGLLVQDTDTSKNMLSFHHRTRHSHIHHGPSPFKKTHHPSSHLDIYQLTNFCFLVPLQRYAVIPLSPNSGLIGWVPQCDTLHALIRDYRAAHKIPLDIERKLMLQVS